MKKVCKICGKEFETNSTVKLTCSRECSAENNRRMTLARNALKRKQEREERERHKEIIVCRDCGKEFVKKHYNEVNCPSCRRKRKRRDTTEGFDYFYNYKPSVIRRCVVCGKVFETTDYRIKTCSMGCKLTRAENHNLIAYDKRAGKEIDPSALITPSFDKDWYERYARCPKDPRKLDKTLARLKEQGVEYADAQRAESIKKYARIEI